MINVILYLKKIEEMILKKKVILFGLGNYYENYREKIEKKFNVIGVTSNNKNEKELCSNYIELQNIGNIEWDYIIICANADLEIFNQLLKMGVVKEKILIANVLFNDRNLFYSQLNEDAIVIMLLHALELKYSDITYLELGTNHPVNLNNTYGLYRLGACGILVEPNKDLHNFIEAIRPRDTLIKKAVSLDGRLAEFYNLKSNELSTLSYDKLDNEFCNSIENFDLKETYFVETITINDLFHLMEKMPEVVSIDIEGYDYAVLNQIDFAKHRPPIFIIELGSWGAKEQDGKRIKELLLKNGYILFHDNGINGIFVDKKYKKNIRQYIVNEE